MMTTKKDCSSKRERKKKKKNYDPSINDEEENDKPLTMVTALKKKGSSRRVRRNPSMDRTAEVSRPSVMKIPPEVYQSSIVFGNYIYDLGAAGLKKLYADQLEMHIPANELYQFKTFSANQHKNRFSDIVCLDHSRVHLKAEEVPVTNDYIHANYVRFPDHDRVYIATQAPFKPTVEDFWIMIFQEKTPVTVCIGKEGENKYEWLQYWHMTPNQHYTFGKMWVHTRKKEQEKGNFAVYTVEVLPEGCSNSHITRLIHVDTWSDRHKYHNGVAICRLIKLMNSVDAMSVNDGPMVIHCTTGIGRTSIVIMVDVMLNTLFARGKTIDFIGLAKQLRNQRMSCLQYDYNLMQISIAVLAYFWKRGLPGFKENHSNLVNDCRKYIKNG